MVNPKACSVYQTDQVFVVYSPRAGGQLPLEHAQDETSTEYVDVQKPHACAACWRLFPLHRCLPRRGGVTVGLPVAHAAVVVLVVASAHFGL